MKEPRQSNVPCPFGFLVQCIRIQIPNFESGRILVIAHNFHPLSAKMQERKI
jgi:hypothetical protein